MTQSLHAMALLADDFAADHAHMLARRAFPGGTAAVFLDLMGNRWDLPQPRVAGIAP